MIRSADLIGRMNDQPFKPFRIHLTDGDAIDVPAPGMVIVGKNTAVLPNRFTRDEEGHTVADTWRTISLIHIVQFSDLDEHVNGKRRKRK